MKKNWKNILIAVLALFSLGKCTQSCNRSLRVDELESEVATKDSTIDSLTKQVDLLKIDTADYIGQINLYRGFTETMTINMDRQNTIAEKNAQIHAEQSTKIKRLEEQVKNKENDVK